MICMSDIDSMYFDSSHCTEIRIFSWHSYACNLKLHTKIYVLYNIIVGPKVLTIVSIIFIRTNTRGVAHV